MRRPTDEELALGGVAAVGVLAIMWETGKLSQAATAVLDVFSRGSKLTDTTPDGSGIIPDDPADLWAAAANVLGRDVDADTYSLGRMGRSEGTDGMEFRMHVALNDLADLQNQYGTGVYGSISDLMLHSKNTAANGHYSEQGLGKRYATTRDPYAGDYELAEKVRADRASGIDLAQGAVKFVDKDSFGVQAGTGSYDAKVSEWAASGLVPFNVDGASSNFVLFKRG